MPTSLRTLLTATGVAGLMLVGQLNPQHGYKSPHTPWGDPDIQGNYGLKNILSAARAEERKADAAAKP